MLSKKDAPFQPEEDVWNYIKSTFSEEIEQRVKEINEISEANNNLIKINFLYGNLTDKLDLPIVTKNGNKIKHKWKVFVKAKDKNLYLSKYISKVMFRFEDQTTFNEVKRMVS